MKPSEIWGDKDSSLRQAFEEAVRREKEEEFMKVFTEATGAKFVDVTPMKPSEIFEGENSGITKALREALARSKESVSTLRPLNLQGPKDEFAYLTPIDQYKCPSYFNDLGELKDCSCGKCK